ncbi:MAG TPA: zinc-binding alcohol dehydrogenase family protein [Stenotrophobium sp.]|jgi:zinc-binding alcohol dehydrogenase family protein|nr:zinc-binding alcohol dehydrogenase family protein [Stenotrophobium sp.]
MKAVGLLRYLPIEQPESLLDLELPRPQPRGRDLLVAVKAVSVNPIDCKQRAPKDKIESEPRVLGWDASGVVEAVGPEVTLFRPGNEVYYAGDITRAGSNSEYQLVDERIVGHKPRKLSFAQAAALPLTALTAWESLFDRLRVSRTGQDRGKRLLVIGGAGGVGSIAIQLAKRVARLTVIATASRPETVAWCKDMGADEVIDHRGDLAGQLRAQGVDGVEYLFCCNDTDQHFPAFAQVVLPQGTVCAIVDCAHPHDLTALKAKSIGFVWESMFTRSRFGTPDMAEQHKILNRVADLVDIGDIRSTLNDVLGRIDAATLRHAHALVESGRSIGKLVLEGF